MSEWVKCTAAGGSGSAILVNLSQALTMSEFGAGTRIALAGNGYTTQTYVDVAETPETLLDLIGVKELEVTAKRSPNSSVGLTEADYKPSLV
jgi:hypothetical protein